MAFRNNDPRDGIVNKKPIYVIAAQTGIPLNRALQLYGQKSKRAQNNYVQMISGIFRAVN